MRHTDPQQLLFDKHLHSGLINHLLQSLLVCCLKSHLPHARTICSSRLSQRAGRSNRIEDVIPLSSEKAAMHCSIAIRLLVIGVCYRIARLHHHRCSSSENKLKDKWDPIQDFGRCGTMFYHLTIRTQWSRLLYLHCRGLKPVASSSQKKMQ